MLVSTEISKYITAYKRGLISYKECKFNLWDVAARGGVIDAGVKEYVLEIMTEAEI